MPVPDFSPGEVLTAAAMDSIGLWLVKSQTVGTGVSSVTVTGAFSSNYDNYKIIYSGGLGSAGSLLGLRLGATASNYYTSYVYTGWNSTITAVGSLVNTSIERFGRTGSQDITYGHGDLFSPFLARNTRFVGQDIVSTDGGTFLAFVPNNTSYTDFTVLPSSGTMTGGTISVYGYRK